MDTGSFNLYFDLEPGKKIDIEIAGRVAIELSQAIKEMAFISDPSLNLKVELISGEEGSLWYKTRVISLAVKDRLSTKRLMSVLIGVSLSFSHIPTKILDRSEDYIFEKIADHFLVGESEHGLTKEELKEIIHQEIGTLEKYKQSTHLKQIYRELHADSAVNGVGASLDPTQKPDNLVPRAEFTARSGHNTEKIEQHTKRIRERREELTLISPVLLEGTRKWEFVGSEGKLSAVIKDQAFLHNVLLGITPIKMVGGIKLDVDIQTVEEFLHGVWVIENRIITKVYGYSPQASQSGFSFGPLDQSKQQYD